MKISIYQNVHLTYKRFRHPVVVASTMKSLTNWSWRKYLPFSKKEVGIILNSDVTQTPRGKTFNLVSHQDPQRINEIHQGVAKPGLNDPDFLSPTRSLWNTFWYIDDISMITVMQGTAISKTNSWEEGPGTKAPPHKRPCRQPTQFAPDQSCQSASLCKLF
jgi:hypothetical protein